MGRMWLLCCWLTTFPAWSQQAADQNFDAHVSHPAFAERAGPTLYLDHGHHNFHRLDGRYEPFAALALNDGFRVAAFEGTFSKDTLRPVAILVIANALHVSNVDKWELPTPSAFTSEEIKAVKRWVKNGGRLLLIADHMPFAGAAADLVAQFGFRIANGFAITHDRARTVTMLAPDIFEGESLPPHPILSGRHEAERISRLATFIGSAFQSPPRAAPLIMLDDRFFSLEPSVAWQFDSQTLRRPLAGWQQAATLIYGKGRIAVYGEAAMMSAQISSDGHKMGFNSPQASENKQFVLNTLHWLAGLLPPK